MVAKAWPHLTAREKRELRDLLAARPMTFREYVDLAWPQHQWYAWNVKLADVLQRVVDGELKRVMVFAPPRHGKSTQVSRLLPGYYLRRYPDRFVGLASYAEALARGMSRTAQGFYQAAGGRVNKRVAAATEWETDQGGGMFAAGAGGPLTGKGLHLGVIDDPLKNAEEALSEVIRQGQKEWWQSTWYTRLEPDAALVVTLTRWHGDDLAGWLLEQEQGDEPERWHIVDFPAIAGEPAEWPATCTVEPEWRKDGEALCPERYPLERLKQIRSRLGPYWWSAMYQQRPRPREGAMFKRPWLQIVAAAPAGMDEVRAWDFAASDGKGDWSAGVKMGRAGRMYYVLDVVRGQWASGDRDRVVRQTATLDGQDVRVVAKQEPGSGGKDQAQAFVANLAGFAVSTLPDTGKKTTKADPLASQAQAGNVALVRGPWNKAFLDELCDFPFGKHDDQVDAAASAFNELSRDLGPGEYRGPVRFSG